MNKYTRILIAASICATLSVNAGCSKSPGAAPHVGDAAVSEHVRAALQRNDQLRGFNIEVETINGDVRLNGILDTQAQIDEVIKIARGSDGAHTIHDELTLKQ
jgi:hyperosmotically inducible periplasmic protein